MSLSVYAPPSETSAHTPWFADPAGKSELPGQVVWDVAALVSRSSRDPGRAIALLDLLARSPRPLSRKRLGDELGIPAAALARTIALLDENGFVSWTKRFGIGLGVRFTEYGEPFTEHLDHTLFCLMQPYLEMLATDHGGTAFVAMRAGDTLSVPRAFGHDTASGIAADEACQRVSVSAGSLPWSSPESWLFHPIAGIWAADSGGTHVVMTARITFAHSAAAIGIRRTVMSVDAYEECCRSLGHAAAQLSSALRRQFPQ